MVGKILGNRYEIIEELGGGGMAIVYKARDRFLNRLVTVKILRPEFTTDKDFINRFQREAQSVARLAHPNIVSIYDVGQEENIHYLVMEYVQGDNLKSIIQREGPLSTEKAIRIVTQICKALHHAHENNIVHRDVKPHNILITSGGWAKLTDFGIAREISAATFTYTDKVMGSVHYLSPEQARGQVVGPRSDLYSLGVVLYEMITGVVPYEGDSPIAVAIKHIQEQPVQPSKLNPKVDSYLERVIVKAMHKNPAFRFDSAWEMMLSLQFAENNTGDEGSFVIPENDDQVTKVLSRVSERDQSLSKTAKRRRLRPVGGILIGLFIVILLMAGAFFFSEYYLGVPEIQVPDVTGKSLAEAKEILGALRLRVAEVEEYNAQIANGYVISQDIGPGDPKVKPPRIVTLTVSLGPDLRVVPDLRQLDVPGAKVKLAEAGLQMAGQIQEEYNDEVPQGYIYKQDPPAFSEQLKGTIVSVYVSKGPRPGNLPVPELIGLDIEQARQRLSENKLKLDEKINWTESTKFLSGQIISQDPAANAQVQEGTAVKLTVSKGPGPVPRTLEVEVSVPHDGKGCQVRINLTDVRGSRDVYIKTHAPGDKFVEVVECYGKTVVRVYFDNVLVKTKTYDG